MKKKPLLMSEVHNKNKNSLIYKGECEKERRKMEFENVEVVHKCVIGVSVESNVVVGVSGVLQ